MLIRGLFWVTVALSSLGSVLASDNVPNRPNILVIYADDLGFGDVQSYNSDRGKIPTPHIDQLAEQGMRFTDAHSSSGVCSPSRYTLLTGRYHWRTRLQQGIVGKWGKPLIAPNRLTIAGLLKKSGYKTACIGKWHLGWDWPIEAKQRAFFVPDEKPDMIASDQHRAAWKKVFSQPIAGGPTTRGFESYFGTDVPNWPPFCFIQDDRTIGVPSEFLPSQLLKKNQASRQGPALSDWKLEPILPTLGDRAARFIADSANGTQPFFLYLPLTSPHTPLSVNDAWRGQSKLNLYADFVMETDAIVGHVLSAIDKSGLSDQTLVLFTSDNGCAPYIGTDELEKKGHYPSGPLRGYKSDVWEGGHRVPFIIRWPGVVDSGAVCSQLVHQADVMATCAEIVGQSLPDNAGEDSFSLLPLLNGSKDSGAKDSVRTSAVSQSAQGVLAIRHGPWKLIFGNGSGGWTKGKVAEPAQFYHLTDDLAESENRYYERTDVVQRLDRMMQTLVADGRSTPGTTQENDVPVRWRSLLNNVTFKGTVVDAVSGNPIPARVYLSDGNGKWIFVQQARARVSALPYREQWVPMDGSVERHTTLSADPFQVELPGGVEYLIEIERGKEYRTLREKVVIPITATQELQQTFRLTRWIDLGARGWYSGETHVHRRIAELPNVMLAEDLNVSFPVAFWTTRSDAAPGLEPSPLRRQGPSPFGPRENRGVEPISVDGQHVIVPRNTEYEIFSVDGRSHVLGAIFLLNHKTVFQDTAPPITDIARRAHQEGALIDLDKHSWPWSMMLVPVAEVDLFELSNNSVWRTRFGFKQTSVALPKWLELERDGPNALTEWGWLNFGFEVYYALLNCGFRIAPTAGTASGVHPVPLGYSRVYVHTGDEFDLQAWLDGLRRGRSFVTTGPMLFATVDGKLAGEEIKYSDQQSRTVRVATESVSATPVSHLEILVNGTVVETIRPQLTQTPEHAWRASVERDITLSESSWLAVRSIEPQSDGRKRFAHTAPWYVSINNQAITPRREQVEYFVKLMEFEIARNRNVLKPEALAEFNQALDFYRGLLRNH